MRQRLKMWGVSLYVRIPRSMAEGLRLEPGSEVEVLLKDAILLIKPVDEPSYSLDQLLDQVTDDNLHREIDWGPAVGEEVW